ncbi:MAG: alpha-ketoglutarate-dependent dioxygenase AlkB [bacterium]|nr:alpha-ketoglutarate-dependent dioxygenase AlkB [bacterium]
MTTILNDDSGEILVYPRYFSSKNLLKELDSFGLQQESIVLFGKQVNQPRLSRLYGKKGTSYKYSGKLFTAIPWTGMLEELAEDCSRMCGVDFNTGLLNYYRDGNDSMGVHADDEKELGNNPVIASVSFGATRKMIFRKRETKEKVIVLLSHGDLLIMRGALQHQWKHELPKEKKVNEPRLNVTFRWVKMPSP